MSLDGKNIIVTGGTGFIGSNLVNELAKKNEVTVIDNMYTGDAANLKEAMKTSNVSLVRKNVTDIAKIKLKEKPDYIFHLGMYSSSPMYKEDNHRVTEVIDGAISIFKYAIKNDAKVIFASTSSLYNGYKAPHKESMMPIVTDFYTEARYAVERLAELYNKLENLNVVGLRFFSVYGPNEASKKEYANLVTQFVWAIKKGRSPIIWGDGKARRDFVYVSDVVDALIKGTRIKGFDIFNVGTGKNYTINEMVEMIAKRSGKKVRPKYIEMKSKNYVMQTLADTTKARKKLHFQTQIDLDTGIRRQLETY